jgi:hypothetical protein
VDVAPPNRKSARFAFGKWRKIFLPTPFTDSWSWDDVLAIKFRRLLFVDVYRLEKKSLLVLTGWSKTVAMNLMFRKNFREQKCGVASKTAKACANRHASKRSSREQGYTPIEEHHYRTHLFFSPPRCSYAQAAEEIDGMLICLLPHDKILVLVPPDDGTKTLQCVVLMF